MNLSSLVNRRENSDPKPNAMTVQSHSTNDFLNGEQGRRDQVVREFDAELGDQSELDDLLSEWRASQDEGSISSDVDLYKNLLPQHRQQQAAAESSIDSHLNWKSGSVSTPDRRGNVSRTSPAGRLVVPKINEEIYGFRLLHELGSGTFAKVFLAKQGDLADRQVVLKISAIEGTEPQTLAQLQHTHVVPIYSVHEDNRFGLRAVCMPYFGGASLNKVLDQVWSKQSIPASGKTLIEALDRVAGPEPATRSPRQETTEVQLAEVNVEATKTSRDTLAALPYVQASAWIIARLAEGLQHSHERNVIHRDIKPSNILLSAEGQPLLLDFNVSQTIDCDPTEATVGGTVAYMSPEQLRALLEHTPESNALVTHRSDIYALGLVFYEMLTGASPFVETGGCGVERRQLQARVDQREKPVPSLKARCRLDIPWSLESIVRKCLAANPAERYASAAQLADDLNRFLQDLPLKFAPELSRIERISKWGRRHPRLTTAGTAMLVAAMLIIPGAFLLHLTRDDLAIKQSLLTDATAGDRARMFQSGTQRALCQINTVTPNEETLKSGIAAAKETLAIYSIITDADWQEDIYWRRLERNERIQLAENVRELLLVLAAAHVRTKPQGATAARRTALDLLQIAERIHDLPPSRALELDRARYLSLLRREADAKRAVDRANKIPVITAHDTYMLAAAHARNRTVAGYREAIRLLTRAIDMSPHHYWSHFERALCYQELGESLLAVSDLGTCIGLWPESSWAHFNRGYLLYEQGHKLEAVEEYTTAIRHSPQFRSAYFNRALAHLEIQNYEDALVDFKKVQELGREDAILVAGRAMALEGMGQHAESDRLFGHALELAKKSPNATTHRLNWTYAFAVARRAPNLSLQVFDSILKVNPKHTQALYGKGMILMQQGDLPGAVRMFDSALNASSTFIEPLRYRAVALARLGQLQQAAADANACIEREPTNPDSLYAAACVAAVSARKLGSAELNDNALQLLHSAIERGVDRERARTDPDFSGLRGDPDFRKLLGDEPKQPEAAKSDSF